MRRLYKEALEIDPENQRAKLGYALILRDSPSWLGGNDQKAEEILKGILSQTPDNVFALHYMGTLYIRNRKDVETGLNYLHGALDVQRQRDLNREETLMAANTYYAIGDVYLNHFKDPSTAVPYFEKAAGIDPESPHILLDLAKAYQKSSRNDNAFYTLQKAAQLIHNKRYTALYDELAMLSEKICKKAKTEISIHANQILTQPE